MRGLVIVSRDDHGVAHDGSVGVSPEGWLPDRVSVGALTRAFPPELVDRVVDTTDTREVRRRLLPARLVVYFVLALWLFRGPNCGAPYRRRGKPWHRPPLQNLHDYDIVRIYGAEYRGIVHYYRLAQDVYRLRTLRWNAETSLLKTLGAP